MSEANQRRAVVLGLAAVGCWATVATAFKLSLQYLTPWQLVSLASWTSLGIFIVTLTWQRRWREALMAWRQRWWLYGVLGAINPAIYYGVLFAAYDRLTAQQAQAINYSWALTYSLLAVPILGLKLRGRDIVALLLAYAGVVLIATGGLWSGAKTDLLGVGLALLSTVLWAVYWLLNTKNKDHPIVALSGCFLVGGGLLALAEIWQPHSWPAQWQAYAGGVYVGVFEMGITFLLWLSALRVAVNSSAISALIFLSPIISLVFIHVFLGESIYVSTLIGLAAILAGLYLQRQQS